MSVLMEIKMNYVGKKFNTLTVLSEYFKNNHTYCTCKCDCGNIKDIRKDALGKVRSCGCLSNNINGLSKTRLHKIWVSMHARCECEKHESYKIYKDKKICDEWHSIPNRAKQTGFLAFYEWAINNGYRDDLSLDRIDNAKGYSPENCRWVTIKQQARNTTKNIVIEMYGEKHILIEWCEIFGISQVKIQHTVKRHGLTYQQAFDRHLNYVYNPSKWCWEKKSA